MYWDVVEVKPEPGYRLFVRFSDGLSGHAQLRREDFTGVLAPLLVRELEQSKYEVIAGARRLRAAKLADLASVPVRIVKLTDAEAIEAQCVELSVVGKIFLG